MAELSYKDKDRFLISVVFAVILHIGLLTALHFILNIRVEALPEYSGPLYLEIETDLSQLQMEEVEDHLITEQPDEVVLEDNKDKDEKADKTREQQALTEDEDKNNAHTDKTREQPALTEKEETNEKHQQPEVREDNKADDQKEDTQAEARNDTENETPDTPDDTKTGENLGNYESDNNTDKESSQEDNTQPAPGPKQTPTPYDPALEENNLALLDELLDNGDSGDPGTDRSTDTDNEASSQNGGPLIEWEDNQNRNPLITYDPEIPDWVSREGKRLRVEVSFLLTPDGLLTAIRIEKSSGYTDVDSSVVASLRKWKFPSIAGTVSVSGRITYFIGIK